MFNAFEWISTTILTVHDYTHRQCDYSELDLRIVIIYAGLVFFFYRQQCEVRITIDQWYDYYTRGTYNGNTKAVPMWSAVGIMLNVKLTTRIRSKRITHYLIIGRWVLTNCNRQDVKNIQNNDA